jgi:hypothetical protein
MTGWGHCDHWVRRQRSRQVPACGRLAFTGFVFAEMSQRANFRNRAVVERGAGHYCSIVTVTPVTQIPTLPRHQPGLFLIALTFAGPVISVPLLPAPLDVKKFLFGGADEAVNTPRRCEDSAERTTQLAADRHHLAEWQCVCRGPQRRLEADPRILAGPVRSKPHSPPRLSFARDNGLAIHPRRRRHVLGFSGRVFARQLLSRTTWR